MLNRYLIFYLFLVGIVTESYGQNFQWIKQIGDQQVDQNPQCKLLSGGQSIVSWNFADSTKIDAFKRKFKKFSNPCAISFINKNGIAKWVWTPDSCSSYMQVTSISYSESKSKIFICGNFDDKIVINSKAYLGHRNGFIIRLDTNGSFEKIYTLSDTSLIQFETMDINNKNEIFLGVYYAGFPNYQLSISALSFTINKKGFFVLKLDDDLVPKNVSEPAYGQRLGKFLLKVSTDNKILNTYTFIDTATIGGKTYFNGSHIHSTYLSYLDSNLILKKNELLFTSSNAYSSISSINSLNNGELIIAGVFEDSISLIPKKNFSNSMVPLFACLDSNLKLKWAKTPEVKSGQTIRSEILDIEVEGDYIYAGGFFIGDTKYDDYNLPKAVGILWFFKTDYRGNILWMNKIGTSNSYQYITSISAIKQKEVLLSGLIVDTVKLNSQTFITTKRKPDILLLKIRDIEIYRGFVKSGPYCAGDTIKIPYSKEGDFNTGNEFIAQLSDADGNFNGKERELGRITSTVDGTIKGTLPMFTVESSPNYRIRILSTNPIVQSYYKYDTLRLLIYSRDKADPGKPETICIGDSIKLNTYGGSKWTWSPKYNMNDSALRQPWVWPKITTNYKIIIADSSGCGKPDTAFKKIIVRSALKSTLAFTDTGVCDITQLIIPVSFEGGDSINYQWKWYSFSNKTRWIEVNSGKLKLGDTLKYSPKVTYFGNDTVAIVLTDNCTYLNDTSFLSISLLKPSIIEFKFQDTMLCKGNLVKWKTASAFALPKYHRWEWLDITNNKVLSTADSLSLFANNLTKIKLSFTNGCTSDSNIFIVDVNPPLDANIYTLSGSFNDTSICAGESLKIFTKGKGGSGKGYKFNWTLGGNLISTSDTIVMKPSSTEILKLVLSDNCTIVNDTVSRKISLIESPRADFIANGINCNLIKTGFTFSGTKPRAPVSTNFKWVFNNEATSNLENPFYTFAIPGLKVIELYLTSSNGCSDSVRKTIIINPKSQSDFITQDVCETDSAIFINKSQDATSYSWRFGDGNTSTNQSPKHLFKINGITQTFNVTLVALVKDGCSDSITKAITINANPQSDFKYTINQNEVTFNAIKDEFNYKWTFGNGDSISGSKKDLVYIYSKLSGKYTACLEVRNIANCFSKTCKDILVTVGLPSLDKSPGFKIYPNPNKGNFKVEIINSSNIIFIEIYDVLGNLVQTVNTFPNNMFYSIDINAPNGIYIVRLMYDNSILNQRVSIQR
jgi:hypothetical protein